MIDASMSVLQKRRRVRHHVNPLQVGLTRLHLPKQEPIFASLTEVLEVEFGCADAEFLFQRAQLIPQNQYVGIEIRTELVHRVRRRAIRQGLSQIHAVVANLNHDLPALFSLGQIDRIFVNFPDPWFKKAQHKRRIVQPEWATHIVPFLKMNGELFFQSDIFELAIEAMTVFEQTPGLQNVHGEWSFAKINPFQAKSLREIRVEEKNLPVWRILYRRGS